MEIEEPPMLPIGLKSRHLSSTTGVGLGDV